MNLELLNDDLLLKLQAEQKKFWGKTKTQNLVFDILGKSKCYTENYLDEDLVMIFIKFFGRKEDIESLIEKLSTQEFSACLRISEDVVKEHLSGK